jgi:hypothetical protein
MAHNSHTLFGKAICKTKQLTKQTRGLIKSIATGLRTLSTGYSKSFQDRGSSHQQFVHPHSAIFALNISLHSPVHCGVLWHESPQFTGFSWGLDD